MLWVFGIGKDIDLTLFASEEKLVLVCNWEQTTNHKAKVTAGNFGVHIQIPIIGAYRRLRKVHQPYFAKFLPFCVFTAYRALTAG